MTGLGKGGGRGVATARLCLAWGETVTSSVLVPGNIVNVDSSCDLAKLRMMLYRTGFDDKDVRWLAMREREEGTKNASECDTTKRPERGSLGWKREK